MKDVSKEKQNYKLHLIKTNKFKTLFFKLSFRENLKEEDIVLRNLLFQYLLYSTNKYKTEKDMTIKKQDLYGAYLNSNIVRYGNIIVSNISLDILDPKYTESNMLEESIMFLKEVIFNPNVKNNSFDDNILKIIKERSINDILLIKNYPNTYGMIKLLDTMNITPISYDLRGKIEEIKRVSGKSLYEYYKKFLKKCFIDISLVGNIDTKKASDLFDKYFIFDTKPEELKEVNLNIYRNKKILVKEENTNNNQTNFFIGCTIKDLTDLEREYIATIYSIILGASPTSKLFMNVRERNSLVYAISSNFKRSDGLLCIKAGISYKNYDKALKAIKKVLKEMTNNITDLELSSSKNLYISALEDTYEYPSDIALYFYQTAYLGARNINESIKIIKNITKEDIYKFAKKVYIDTIYVLKEK